ncbi:MAG: hypothetical protein JSR82_08350 [Verrucomicrobia bacterium]|nr:hypothetical protein [Verrucomicrobiota bacterium]
MDAPPSSPLLTPHEQLGILALRFLHDLANHASAFYGFSSILTDEVPPGSPGREMVEQLTAAADRFGTALGEFGAFKSQLTGRLPVISAMEATLSLAAGLPAMPGWVMAPPTEIATGQRLAAEPRWLQHLAAVIVRRAPSGGEVRFRCVTDQGEPHASVVFAFRGDPGLAERIWFAAEGGKADLSCAREIVRRFGGKSEVDLASRKLQLRFPLVT